MGCCRINPCASGCPSGEVLAGFLSSNPGEAADFLPSSSATTASHSATSSSGASAAGTSSSGSIQDTSAAAATTRVSQSIHHTNTGTIAGSAIGGFVAVAILLTVFALLFRRRAIRSRQQAAHSRARARAAGKEIPDQDVKHASETAPLSKDMEKNEYSQGKLTRTCVEDEKADLIIEAHELMSIPADTNASGRPYSELDGGGLVQRTPGPSPQPPPGFSSPHVSSISSDSPRLHQSWGGHSYGRDSVM
ncbi:uncharacterized protein KY384_009035 [Bacidia gigantensis]|uniref:uncharacterized protein n=1 Tax=Bacidia gigantensis TaxID=2732470 RepID=UPI001D03E859|nr:uncharacterized protein KY384_009035 [Bacidia gigantensis]KAG8525391.1 hypothetical protein KY384_009035 [Bacidia gigantensis]